MAAFRYPQFCALARAAEVLGARWTLLIVRELLLGPKRFSDLRARLDGVSASVLSTRLEGLEQAGVVRRRHLPAPAASTVYELTAMGQALEPAVFALIRWGARLLWPPRRGERLEPAWVRLALAACARRAPTPAKRYQIDMPGPPAPTRLHVAGGRKGVTVREGSGAADVTILADAGTVLALMSGLLDAGRARRAGRLKVRGDAAALAVFPQLFAVELRPEGEG